MTLKKERGTLMTLIKLMNTDKKGKIQIIQINTDKKGKKDINSDSPISVFLFFLFVFICVYWCNLCFPFFLFYQCSSFSVSALSE